MDRAKASRSFLGVPGPDDQEDEDPPDPGWETRTPSGPALTTGRPAGETGEGQEDRGRPGQRRAPPRQGA